MVGTSETSREKITESDNKNIAVIKSLLCQSSCEFNAEELMISTDSRLPPESQFQHALLCAIMEHDFEAIQYFQHLQPYINDADLITESLTVCGTNDNSLAISRMLIQQGVDMLNTFCIHSIVCNTNVKRVFPLIDDLLFYSLSDGSIGNSFEEMLDSIEEGVDFLIDSDLNPLAEDIYQLFADRYGSSFFHNERISAKRKMVKKALKATGTKLTGKNTNLGSAYERKMKRINKLKKEIIDGQKSSNRRSFL